MKQFDDSKLHQLLCYFLILVGFLQFIGVITNSSSLKNIGLATAASPLPEVFGSAYGFEPMSHEFVYQFRLADGSSVEKILTRSYSDRFATSPGHLNRFGPLLYAVLWTPIIRTATRERFLRKAFCHGGEFAQRIDLPSNVQSFHISVRHKETLAIEKEYDVSCVE